MYGPAEVEIGRHGLLTCLRDAPPRIPQSGDTPVTMLAYLNATRRGGLMIISKLGAGLQ